MAKPTKSQWDFGELFPVETKRTVLTVAELTAQVKRLLEKQVGQIWVTGEITNFRAQSSGHCYFTLKDAESQLSCVLFRNEARDTREFLQDGRKVILQGDLTVYEPRGQYQLRVTAIELQGVGALQAAFEKLKQKLNDEGLFAAGRKRPLPRFVNRIGLVTSPTGAAIQDVLHVVRRRHPALEIILVPCRVQGQGAAEEIAAAIKLLNDYNRRATQISTALDAPAGNPLIRPSGTFSPGGGEGGDKSNAAVVFPLAPTGGEGRGEGATPVMAKRIKGSADSALRTPHSALDLILVTRGGGSLEDLWAFNEEVVARAIFESALPVVSAVGHEIDFTISDFVADIRAATPSAAAEILTEGFFSSVQFVSEAAGRIRELLRQRMDDKLYEFDQVRQRLARAHPRRRLNELLQRLDDLQNGLGRCVRQGTRTQQLAWRNLRERLMRLRPRQILEQRRELLALKARRLAELARHQAANKRIHLDALESRLRLLGPEQVLARGYSITLDADNGRVIRAAAEVKPGQKLRTRLKTGEVRSTADGG